MKIRSITVFYDPSRPGQELDRLADLVGAATRRFNEAGFEVQTTRAAVPPFYGLLPEVSVEGAVQLARRLEAETAAHGFAYVALGPAVPEHPETYALVAPMIAATQNAFVTGVMATADGGISLPAVKACGAIIAQAAGISPDGFANLRFAALANVPAHVPFFPAAYHSGGRAGFALAVECADVAVTAFTQAETLEGGRELLLHELNNAGATLSRLCAELAARFDVDFKGIDFSLAPFPEDCCSLGGAMEALGVPSVGLLGSLGAAAILADTLDRGTWPRAGFNGMMMPVLEDSILAARGGGTLEVKDLLLYSAVCGAGLDTVPLPGDATAGQLSALLLDVATLAVRLGKPLTARLMPVPGKKAGDTTEFSFGYFANGRILALPAEPLTRYLSGDEDISLHPRFEYR